MNGAERGLPWVALSLESVIDPRPAVLWVIHALSSASPKDVAELEATGEYDDPWHLARVANCWVRGRRPRPIPSDWRVLINQCGGDPGDLTAKAQRLYAHLGWRQEAVLVDAARLGALSAYVRLAVVTDRDRAGLARAEERIGFHFPTAVTAEDAWRPDPQALLRLGKAGHFLGHGPRDRACAEGARFAFHELGASPVAVIDRLITKLSPQVPASGL